MVAVAVLVEEAVVRMEVPAALVVMVLMEADSLMLQEEPMEPVVQQGLLMALCMVLTSPGAQVVVALVVAAVAGEVELLVVAAVMAVGWLA